MNITYTEKEISEVAKNILENSTSKIFLFYGNMGVGKTTLIKELSHQLGTQEVASSPSFSIVNEYEIQDGLIYHFDFYRIEKPEEAWDLGIEDYFYSGHYIFIEWPEKIAGLLPENCTSINIDKNPDGSRTLSMDV